MSALPGRGGTAAILGWSGEKAAACEKTLELSGGVFHFIRYIEKLNNTDFGEDMVAIPRNSGADHEYPIKQRTGISDHCLWLEWEVKF